MNRLSILSLVFLALFVTVAEPCTISEECVAGKMCEEGKCIGVGLMQLASLLRQQQAKRSGEAVTEWPTKLEIVIPEW